MDEESLIQLRDAIMRTARSLRTTASGETLSPGQSSVLATLVREGPTGAGELAAAEAMNPTMLSRVLAHLEEEGLVRRGPSPGDARCTIARATPAGRRRVQRIRARRSMVLLQWLERLDPADAGRLAAALPALTALSRAAGDA